MPFKFKATKNPVEHLTLDNGLTILLENIPHRTSATVGLWLPMGSRFEKKDEAGYSHFVEHMLFKGTKKRDYTEISRSIDRLGGHMNASTSKEITDYYISLSGRHLPIAIDVLADMFYDSLFAKNEFDSEKKVIIEELKMTEDQPDDFLFDLFFESQLGDNSLGRPVGGYPSSIMRSTRDKLHKFYCTHYGPEGAVLSLAGSLFMSAKEKSTLVAAIRKAFDRTNHTLAGKPGYRRAGFTAPEFQTPRSVKQQNLKHRAKDLEQMNFVISLPGLKTAFNQKADLQVLTHYLGGTMSSKLFTELREKKGLCYSVGTFHSQFLHEGVWGISCATSPEKYVTAVETALQEVSKLTLGIEASELEESKSGLKGGIELSMESAYRRASFNARSWLYYGERPDWHDYLTRVDRVTPETFSAQIKTLWGNASPGVTSLGPKISPTIERKLKQLVKTPVIS